MSEPTEMLLSFVIIRVEVVQVELGPLLGDFGLPHLLLLLAQVPQSHLVLLGHLAEGTRTPQAFVHKYVVLASRLELVNELCTLQLVPLRLLSVRVLFKRVVCLLLLFPTAGGSSLAEVPELLSSLSFHLVVVFGT